MVAVPVLTQRECEALVAAALRDAADNCLDLQRNSACYGYSRVDAAFADVVPDDFFVNPADRTDLEPLVTLRTGALDLTTDEWGVALLNVQANLPDTLPGQAVTFVLLGDTSLQDATAARAAKNFQPISVTTTVNTNFRSGPGLNYNVVMVAEQEATLMADGISPDGKWLRVLYDNAPGWIHYTLVKTDGDMSTLPPVDATQYSPMQAFYLTTGLGQAACKEAPDVLLIQGPQNYEITLSVNGAILEMGSTVLFRTIENNEQAALEITVLDGRVTLAPDAHNPRPVIIPAGTRSTACLDTSGDNPVVACRWSEPRTSLSANWCSLETFPTDLLHYPIHAHCHGSTPLIQVSNPITPVSSDILAEAARQNDSLTANPSVLSAVSSSENQAECVGFALLRGGENMVSQYEWSSVAGADQYKLNLYGSNGQIVASRWFASGVTNVTLNIADFATGGAFQWEVEAQQNGRTVCYTPRSEMRQRPGDPNAVVLLPVFTASCTYTLFAPHVISVTWANGDSGDVVTISATDTSAVTYTTVGFGSGDTIFITGGAFAFTHVTVNTTSGKSFTLAGC